MNIVDNRVINDRVQTANCFKVGDTFYAKPDGFSRSLFLKCFNTVVDLKEPNHTWTGHNGFFTDIEFVNAEIVVKR